ncbi:MAG: very short patch repair endonuclease [Bacteroidales bacterium]|nr:very short patch repair endonuclease [Bacteroidales bacterium]
MDKFTKEQRHNCMSAIRSKDTKPEMLVRKYLFSKGFRYRLHHNKLPGHPDLVLKKYRAVIFINGCFWHGHEDCKYSKIPKTNTEFWEAKIRRNQARDRADRQTLAQMGWHSITIWECLLKPNLREQTLESVVAGLRCLCEKPLSNVRNKTENKVFVQPDVAVRKTPSVYKILEPLFHLAAEDSPEYSDSPED